MGGSARPRLMPGVHWLAFYLLLLAAWAAIYLMQAPLPFDQPTTIFGPAWWSELCSAGATTTDLPTAGIMWGLMALGMMTPTFLPALATYDDLLQAGAARRTGFWALLAGYLSVWLAFALLAAQLQVTLAAAGLLTAQGESVSRWLTAGLLALAGGYQFSAVKAACLSRCRRPLAFFMQHWREGPWGAAVMGLRLGGLCLGCCWALMLLAFIGGAMNLFWMGLGMVLMTFEKLPDVGRLVTRPLGGLLVLAAAWVLAM